VVIMSLKAQLKRLEQRLEKSGGGCRVCRERIRIVDDEKEITEDFYCCPVCGRVDMSPVIILSEP